MRAIVCLFLFISLSINYAQTLEESVELISSLSDSAQVDSMIRLSRLNAVSRNAELGIEQAWWALRKAQLNHFKDLIPKARFYIARNHNQKNNSDSAIFHYKKGLKELENTKTESWKIYFINSLAINYRQIGDFKKAINIQLDAIKEYEEGIDSSSIAKLYTEIGYSYDRMKDFKQALLFHRKAIQILGDKDPSYEHFIYGRIAIAYDDLNLYDSAHYYNFKALKYMQESGDSAGVGVTASNIGNTFLKQKKWAQSEVFLKRSIRLNLIHGDDGNRAITHINLGNVQIEQNEFKTAEESLNKGLWYAQSWNNMKFISEAYFKKSKLFERMRKQDSALFYFKAFKDIEDSLYNIERVHQINELNTRFETEKKEQQIKNQRISLSQKESQLLAKQRTILALIILTVLILVISIAVYKRFQAKKNAETQKAIIKEQEKGLLAVLYAQEEERKRISKELHDGVGQQLSGFKMAFQRFANKILEKHPNTKEEIDILNSIITESADEVRSISHQMMPRALSELGLIPAIEDMLAKSLKPNNFNYVFENHGIENRLPENIEVPLFRILQELVNNILKHAHANNVSVQLFKNKNKIIMIVEDNGKGFQSDINSEGHGLLNIKSRLNTIKGDVNYDPSPGSGTIATIRIPLS